VLGANPQPPDKSSTEVTAIATFLAVVSLQSYRLDYVNLSDTLDSAVHGQTRRATWIVWLVEYQFSVSGHTHTQPVSK